MTVAALGAHAMLSGNHFAQYAAQMIALDPQVQRYVLDANANRPNRETVRILTSLLTAALRAAQDEPGAPAGRAQDRRPGPNESMNPSRTACPACRLPSGRRGGSNRLV